MVTLYLTKEARIYKGEKIISLTTGAGKTGQLLVKKMKLEHFIGEGNGTPLQYSCLTNPMDGGAWWAAVRGVAKGRT